MTNQSTGNGDQHAHGAGAITARSARDREQRLIPGDSGAQRGPGPDDPGEPSRDIAPNSRVFAEIARNSGVISGGAGIRTLGTLARTTVFETALAFQVD